jgi:small subunit ribosomal protein S11
MTSKATSQKKKKQKQKVSSGIAFINSTFNNTFITVSDVQGNVLAWSSAGHMGFSGSKQSTPHAAQIAGEDVAKKSKERGIQTLEVRMSGPGSGGESAVRAIHASGIFVNLIRNTTPLPHNGCRPPKRRRV